MRTPSEAEAMADASQGYDTRLNAAALGEVEQVAQGTAATALESGSSYWRRIQYRCFGVMVVAAGLLMFVRAPKPSPTPLGRTTGPSVTYIEKINHGFVHDWFGADIDPSNPANRVCEPDADDPALRCPAACSKPPPVIKTRVRIAVHRLSAEQWNRVVGAMWVMRTVPTNEGVERYGPFYRDWDYFLLMHGVHADFIPGGSADVTAGASHFATWHAAHVLDFETSLLAVDPEILALPYIDWVAMPQGSELFNTFFGAPTGNITEYYMQWADKSQWSVPSGWTVRSMMIDFQQNYTNVSLLTTSNAAARSTGTLAVVDNGPFAHWPVPAGQIAKPGGRTLEVLKKQDGLRAVLKAGGDGAAYWGDADGALAKLRATQPPAMSAMTLPCFFLMRDYAADLDGTQMRDPMLAVPVPYIVRRTDDSIKPGDAPADPAAMAALIQRCTNIGNLVGELVACLTGRLVEQPYDMHDKWHASVGGDVEGVGGPNDPLFWFHHAAVDKMRLLWQSKNPQLRHLAYGYFAKSAFSTDTRTSNSAPADLHDVIGAPPRNHTFLKLLDPTYDPVALSDPSKPATTPLLGIGFDRKRLFGEEDHGMSATVREPMTNADMICGKIEHLYSYDDIVAAEWKQKAVNSSSDPLVDGLHVFAAGALLAAVVTFIFASRRVRQELGSLKRKVEGLADD